MRVEQIVFLSLLLVPGSLGTTSEAREEAELDIHAANLRIYAIKWDRELEKIQILNKLFTNVKFAVPN
jgi:hypothetical protein